MTPDDCVEGHRYVAVLRTGRPDCAARRMREMDEFFLRNDPHEIRRISDNDVNPFFPAVVAEAVQHEGLGGLAVHRQHLTSLPVGALPGCDDVSWPVPEPAAGAYRAHSLEEFFSGMFTEESFVGPVFGALGADIDIDLTGLVTAKTSGFMIKTSGNSSFVRPWGGHRTVYAEATRLGILEGIERIGAESPTDVVLPAVPPAVRTIDPDEFGLAGEDWLIDSPEVRAWSTGRSLLTGEEVALPTRLVYYNPHLEEDRWVQESSNGCAIGGSDDEAQLFGLLEAIERDAFLVAWYGALALDEIRADSVTDPLSRIFLERMTLCGQQVRFFDATVGVDIPTVIAVCMEQGGSTCVGAGSHPDVERALHAALIEVASDFQVVAQHRRERDTELAAMLDDYSLVRSMEDHADMFAHPDARPLLAPWLDSDHRLVGIDSLKRPGSGRSVGDDLENTVAACREANFEPIAVQTQTTLADAVGARCWKVVVPGLIPIDFGFGYQRALKMPRLARVAQSFRAERGESAGFVPYIVPHPFP